MTARGKKEACPGSRDPFSFLPRDAHASAVYAVAVVLCLYVCLSATQTTLQDSP